MDRRQFTLAASRALAGAALTPALTAGVSLNAALSRGAQPRQGWKRRLLVFTKSSGFEHDIVKQPGGAPSLVERVLTALGEKEGFGVTATKDGRIFTPAELGAYDALLFVTTGDLTTAGTDGEPPMAPAGKAALLDAVAGGLGFAGVHCASDTFHTPPETPDRANRYVSHAGALDPYLAMLGGEFIAHGPPQQATVRVADPSFPGMPPGPELTCHGEWYSLKDFATDLHVLLVLQTEGMRGSEYQRPPYPVAWARRHGRGRVFFTALGHFEAEWSDQVFLDMLAGGLRWAFGDVEADLSPNLERVAPGHAKLPPAPAQSR